MRSVVDIIESCKENVVKHLVDLSPESKRMRFFSNISEAGVNAYVDRINWKKDVCFGVYSGNTLTAFVHLAYSDGDQYELGISVSEDSRGEGLAKTLMQRVITWCKANGVTKLVMECLRENKGMQHISKKLGMRIVNDHETALAEAAITTTFAERITEIQKNMMYENVAIIDRSMRSFYNQCLMWRQT